jgi:hypothetical protein
MKNELRRKTHGVKMSIPLLMSILSGLLASIKVSGRLIGRQMPFSKSNITAAL